MNKKEKGYLSIFKKYYILRVLELWYTNNFNEQIPIENLE